MNKKMNQSDIQTISKLKELRDKNALTQEEFDEQVANYLNISSVSEVPQNNVTSTTQGGKNLLWLVVACVLGYICIETMFPKAIECSASATTEQCECVRQAVARNASFMDKARILFTGASKEELKSYLGINGLACAFMGN